MRDQWTRTSEAAVLDAASITTLLQSVIPTARISGIARLSGGLSNTNVRIDLEDRAQPLVLRLYQRNPAAAAVERAVLALCGWKGLPAPRVLHAADDSPIAGGPFSILEWIEGSRLDEAMAAGADGEVRALAASVGSVLAAIHSITFERAGFFDRQLRVPEPIGLGSAELTAYLRQCLREGRGGEENDLARP